LALLVQRGAELDSSVLLAGQSPGGFVGRATRRLFAALGGGTPLAEAIRRFPRALPREALAYAAAGQTMQAEAAALKELSRSDHTELTSIWRACVERISYLACVLLFMSGVLAFLMIKIIPQFNQIFDEFDIELPAITELAIIVSAYQMQNAMLGVLMVVVVIALVVMIFVVGLCYLLDFPVLQSMTDRLFRGRRVGDVLRILAVATEHRQPLAGVLARLARDFPSDTIRRRLRSATEAVVAGSDWRDALRDARLVSPAEHGLLKTAEQVGNLPWALRTIAARNERRGVYRLSAAIQVLYPCVILLLGALVAFFVVALFFPIVRLINGLV
jgi:type II secretory pathway component PulF